MDDDMNGKLSRLFEILGQKDPRFCTSISISILSRLLSGDDGYYYRIIGYSFDDNSDFGKAFVNVTDVEAAWNIIKVYDLEERVLKNVSINGRKEYVVLPGSCYDRFIIKSIERYKKVESDLSELLNTGPIHGPLFGSCPELRERIDNVANDNTGGNSMSKASETMQMVVSMKMLKGLMSDGKGKEADLGKLMIMQQMMSGEKLQVSDVLKAKLINEFSLDESKDLPIEKVMLLQMLDGGEIDMTQLISMKMFGELFKDDEEKKSE